MLFPRLFEQSVARTPDRTAVVDVATGDELTYADLRERARALAAGLRERGVERGDRVAVCLPNRPETVELFVATQLAGAVFVPFNFRLPAGDVRYHLRDSDPSLFVFDDRSSDAVAGAEDAVDVPAFQVRGTPLDVADPFDALRGDADEAPDVTVDYDDPSVMLYSSGTTGDPKGIPIDHESTTARHLANSLGQHYYLGETIVGIMPLYHTVGLHGILCGLLGMSGTYLAVAEFDPETVARAIETYEVSALHEAPTIFQQLLATDAIDDVDVSSVRTLGFSGAPMNEGTFDAVLELFDPDHFANLYGTTEAYGTLAYYDLQDGLDPATTGPANVFHDTRVVELRSNDPDAVVDPGEEGELAVNTDSPITFDGYWNKPEETENAIHDGWFFTGDAVRKNEDGTLVLTGRADDMIVTGGENVYPIEVEDVLSTHADVADVAVVGLPDDEWGERVTAYVVTDGDVTADDLDAFCRASEDLADFKRPRRYEFVESLPRNPSGKVLRYELRGDE